MESWELFVVVTCLCMFQLAPINDFSALTPVVWELWRWYERVSKRFRTESITKYMLTNINTHWEVKQRVMATKLIRLTHKIAIRPPLVAESCTICSSRSRRPVRKRLDTSSHRGMLEMKWFRELHSQNSYFY